MLSRLFFSICVLEDASLWGFMGVWGLGVGKTNQIPNLTYTTLQFHFYLFCLLSRFSGVQLCEPYGLSPPGSSVHGNFQARIPECPPPGDLSDLGIKPTSLTSPALAGRQVLYHQCHLGSPSSLLYTGNCKRHFIWKIGSLLKEVWKLLISSKVQHSRLKAG